jgi:hypothetical protein
MRGIVRARTLPCDAMAGTNRALRSMSLIALFAAGCGGAPGTRPTAASGSAAEAPLGPDDGAAEPGRGAAPLPTGWPFGPTPSEADTEAQLARLLQDPGPLKSNWVPPGRRDRYGHAEGLIDAPYDVVRAKLVDFAHYKDLAGPKFKSVRVVGKDESGTDVYFQLPIMKGLVTIWYVTRFPAPRPAAGGGEIVEGRFVKGNIKGMHIAFTVRPAPAPDRTVLVCDLLLSPSVPAPQSAVDEELRDACGDAVKAVRRKTSVRADVR